MIRLAAVFLAATAYEPALAQSVMQPGAWQMQTMMSARDPATGDSRVISDLSMKVCMTKEFIAKNPYFDNRFDHAKMAQKKAKCSATDVRRQGDSASWTASCQMPDGRTIELAIRNTASAQSLVSDIKQTLRNGQETFHMQMFVKGTYIGACTEGLPQL